MAGARSIPEMCSTPKNLGTSRTWNIMVDDPFATPVTASQIIDEDTSDEEDDRSRNPGNITTEISPRLQRKTFIDFINKKLPKNIENGSQFSPKTIPQINNSPEVISPVISRTPENVDNLRISPPSAEAKSPILSRTQPNPFIEDSPIISKKSGNWTMGPLNDACPMSPIISRRITGSIVKKRKLLEFLDAAGSGSDDSQPLPCEPEGKVEEATFCVPSSPQAPDTPESQIIESGDEDDIEDSRTVKPVKVQKILENKLKIFTTANSRNCVIFALSWPFPFPRLIFFPTA